jgi:hypothetical protein
VEYQQGELQGYEVREYLLAKWNRTCAYCDAQDVPLEIEHIQSKSKGGSNRVTNLTLACRPCNQRKGNVPVEGYQGTVRILMDSQDNGVPIAEFIRDDGWNLGLELIRSGMAKVDRRYCDEIGYTAAESEAKEAGLGLWPSLE